MQLSKYSYGLEGPTRDGKVGLSFDGRELGIHLKVQVRTHGGL